MSALAPLIARTANPDPSWRSADFNPSLLLPGDTHRADYDALKYGLEASGWRVIESTPPKADINGMTEYHQRTIFIDEKLSGDQKFLTLAHEATHALHGPVPVEAGSAVELLAESSAFLVARARGLDATDSSAAYFSRASVPDWAFEGIEPVAVVAAKKVVALIDKYEKVTTRHAIAEAA